MKTKRVCLLKPIRHKKSVSEDLSIMIKVTSLKLDSAPLRSLLCIIVHNLSTTGRVTLCTPS